MKLLNWLRSIIFRPPPQYEEQLELDLDYSDYDRVRKS